MDPSIMKLLEEDEDETMHSGADVEALTAALNRDISGDFSRESVSQGNHQTSGNLFSQWQASNEDPIANLRNQQLRMLQQDQTSIEERKQQSSGEIRQPGAESSSNKLENFSLLPGQLQENKVHETHARNIPLQFTGVQVFGYGGEHSETWMQRKRVQDNFQQWHDLQLPLRQPQATGVHILERKPVAMQKTEDLQNADCMRPSKIQKMNSHPSYSLQKEAAPKNQTKVSFGLLLSILQPQLDKQKSMQLELLFAKLKNNEIPRDRFLRLTRSLVGNEMLEMAAMKLQMQSGSHGCQVQSHASSQQHSFRNPSSNAQQIISPHSISQLHHPREHSFPGQSSRFPTSAAQIQTGFCGINAENNPREFKEVEHQSDSKGKQQQQYSNYAQTPISMYECNGAINHLYSAKNANALASSLNPQSLDLQIRQLPLHQNSVQTQAGYLRSVQKHETQGVGGGTLTQMKQTLEKNSVMRQISTSTEHNDGHTSLITTVKQEQVEHDREQHQKSHRSTSLGSSTFLEGRVQQGDITPGTSKEEPVKKDEHTSRTGFSASTIKAPPNLLAISTMKQTDQSILLSSQSTPETSPGVSVKAAPKRPSAAQKKPLEEPHSPPSLPGKTQKVSGSLLDESMKELKDVFSVSGVNIREEEEQLFCGPKEDNRVSDASRRIAQEEEEALILQRIPLQKKLAQIMAKCGVMGISNDVERCLSLCTEERLRGLINNSIRMSKQRIDTERTKHTTFPTSDVQQQILLLKRKAEEEWKNKQAESDGRIAEEKDEGRAKLLKLNKEQDDKMRTTAANVAARAAAGGDDILSKWKNMAEQARQKPEGKIGSASTPGKDMSCKGLHREGGSFRAEQEARTRGQSPDLAASGGIRKVGRNKPVLSQRMARTISVKDVIAVLEREPQMSKSTLIHNLYEKICSNVAAV